MSATSEGARSAGAPVTIRPARGRARFFGVTLGGIVVLGLLVGGCNAWVHVASRDRIHHIDDAPPQPVALVLGAAVNVDGSPSPFLSARLDLAAELLRRGQVGVLLLSGDARADRRDEPTAMRDYLISRGVDPAHLRLDSAGRDTYDSCASAARSGVSGATIVTQGYHLPRALAICRAVGLEAVGVGDETMRDLAPGVWAAGQTREIPAAVKAAVDVLSRRDPRGAMTYPARGRLDHGPAHDPSTATPHPVG